ncbi:MAG: 30S ribosomal protein S6e [Candidatus Micrarchaeia archaeon]|jgi:small subunit ribosomal protein S6e
MKLVVSDPKAGKTYQADLEKGKEVAVMGKKIGETFDGGMFGAAGYVFQITGGSDSSGFPMRNDISGSRKISALLTKGLGFRTERKGERRKKMVRGNSVADDTAQLNVKVTQAGATPLEQIFPKKAGEAKK